MHCAVDPDPVRNLRATFSFLEESKVVIRVVFCSQQSHINSLRSQDNTSIAIVFLFFHAQDISDNHRTVEILHNLETTS